jgi:hypothetical protein
MFEPAKDTAKYLKLSVYGPPGSGKTFFALGWPKPAVIDLEHGTVPYSDRFEFGVEHTKSAASVLKAVEFMATGKHDFQTLIIDPITLVWEEIQDAYLQSVEDKVNAGGRDREIEIQQQDWRKVRRPHKKLMRLLLSIPMHIILIGRQEVKYKVGSDGSFQDVGVRFGGEKSVPYDTDVLMCMLAPEDNKGKYLARVEKDRWGALAGQTIEKISYEHFSSFADKTMSGNVLEVENEDAAADKDSKALFSENGKKPPSDREVSEFIVLLKWAVDNEKISTDKHDMEQSWVDTQATSDSIGPKIKTWKAAKEKAQKEVK